jgi:hypothetical protein
MAFHPLVPQHPQFLPALKEISLELRLLFLKWHTAKPSTADAIGAMERINDTMVSLIDRYSSAINDEPAPSTKQS